MHFYTLTTNDQKAKLRNFLILNCIKKNKYLGINLPKEVKNLYSGNYKIVMKKLKIIQTVEKIRYTALEKLIVKMTTLPMVI